MKAYIFPGQGAQFTGMGKDLYESSELAKSLFEKANEILGFRITDIMFEGTAEQLKETKVTQPAIFLHSVILAKTIEDFKPEMVAGHSLGEFSALVANGTLSFEDGLKLVSKRAMAMQRACEITPSTMAAVLNLDDKMVENICASVEGIVVAANYNCPGQLVISGEYKAVEVACEKMKEAGAKRALILPVGGAFHSPMMEPAREELAAAIEATTFSKPICAVYQNVTSCAVSDAEEIKKNLIIQLTAPVKWTQSVQQMILDGATSFTEIGPGKVLVGLVNKINTEVETITL
jgi:[acyl-carrier-protein] S-malonyltransferase